MDMGADMKINSGIDTEIDEHTDIGIGSSIDVEDA